MKISKKTSKQLAELVSGLSAMPNIWNASAVKTEPQKLLERWQIYKVTQAKIQPEVFGFHLVGFDVRGMHGAVSSKVEQFDPSKMCGITKSGRIYQLVGLPGLDLDAQYTLDGWANANHVLITDATEEFIQHYEINLDYIRTLNRKG